MLLARSMKDVNKTNAQINRLVKEIAELRAENKRLNAELRNLYKTVNTLMQEQSNANG